MKHTPGPWHAMDPSGAFPVKWVIVSEHVDDAIVASVGGALPGEDADARLIAAAPEMLAYLKRLREAVVRDESPSLVTLDEVIAKAEASK